MEQNAFFSAQEKVRLAQLYRELLKLSGNILYPDDCKKLKTYLLEAARRNLIQRNVFGMNPILNDMETALIVASEIGLTRGAILCLPMSIPTQYAQVSQPQEHKKISHTWNFPPSSIRD